MTELFEYTDLPKYSEFDTPLFPVPVALKVAEFILDVELHPEAYGL